MLLFDPMDEVAKLTLERLRGLEEAQTGTNERLDRMDLRFQNLEDALGRIVTVLEAHDRRFEQMLARLDRLIELTTRARSEDLTTFAGIDRRLRALEERNATPPEPPG